MMQFQVFGETFKRAALVAVAGFGLLSQFAMAQPQIEATHKVAAGGIYELVFNPTTETVLVAAAGQRGWTTTPVKQRTRS